MIHRLINKENKACSHRADMVSYRFEPQVDEVRLKDTFILQGSKECQKTSSLDFDTRGNSSFSPKNAQY